MARAATLEPGSALYLRWISEVESLADQDLRATAMLGARLLALSAGAIGGLEEGDQPIGRGLRALRHWAEDLSPPDLSAAPRRLLGLFAGADPVRAYLDRWRGAEGEVEHLVGGLRDAEGRLTADNAAVAQEQLAISTQLLALRQYDHLAARLDARLVQVLDAMADTERAARLRQDLVYTVRRRRQEILTQLAVATQGEAALAVIADNNRAVIRAIQGATTSTMAAMQTAVAVGQALANRRRLRRQLQDSVDIVGQVEVLQRAWADLDATLTRLDLDRQRAVASMSAAVRQVPGYHPVT